MKIEVNLFATLVTYKPENAGRKAWFMNCPEGTTIAGLLKDLNVPLDAVKIMFVNGVHASDDTVLKDGDRLGVFPPVGGG